jgi:hypothetical protein
MKIRIIPHHTHKYVTSIGYWHWTKPGNKGELIIEVSQMKSRRHVWAVVGHELIEAFYCWVFHKTTEQCDLFDDWMDREYETGKYPLTYEGGFHPQCPYRWGHWLGVIWEYVCIYGTFASFSKYEAECNKLLGIET